MEAAADVMQLTQHVKPYATQYGRKDGVAQVDAAALIA